MAISTTYRSYTAASEDRRSRIAELPNGRAVLIVLEMFEQGALTRMEEGAPAEEMQDNRVWPNMVLRNDLMKETGTNQRPLWVLFNELWSIKNRSHAASWEALNRAQDAAVALCVEPWCVELLMDKTPYDVVDNMSTLGNGPARLVLAVKRALTGERW